MLPAHGAFLVLLITGTLVGFLYVPYNALLLAETKGFFPGLGAHLLNIFAQFARILYPLAFVLFPTILIGVLVYISPLIVAALIDFFTRTPVSAVAARSASSKLPDRLVAAQLAQAMRAQNFDDQLAQQLFMQLSPWRQWLWKVSYAKRVKEADRVRKVVNAQTQAMREETGLAQDTFTMERTRRARYD